MLTPEFKEQASLKQAIMFLIYKEGKFLFENRKDPNKAYFGYTIIPGGKVEEGESPEQAMIRETREERGVTVKKFYLLDSFEDISTLGNHYLMFAYLITEIEGEIRNNEAEKADNVWVSLEEAWKHAKFANNRHPLNLAEKKIIEEGLRKD